MGEPITTAALFGLAIALVEIIKKLVEKLTAKKEDENGPSLASVDRKVDACAAALVQVSNSQERICDTLDRIENRLERVSDATAETRLRLLDGRNNH